MAKKAHVLRSKRCKHVHYSGRRCSALVDPKRQDQLCGLHRDDLCKECEAMQRAFPIRGTVTQNTQETGH